jgi:beta-lactamase class A
VQLLVPSDRVLPNTKLSGQKIGLKTKDAISKDLVARNSIIKIKFGDKTEEFDAAKVGVSMDVTGTVDALPTLSIVEKIVPFMPIVKSLQKHNNEVVTKADDKVLKQFSEETAKNASRQPINAVAEVKDGALIIKKHQDGEVYSPEIIERTLRGEDPFMQDNPLAPQPKLLPAQITSEQTEPLRAEFGKKINQTLQVSFGSTAKQVNSKMLASWLVTNQDPATHEWRIGHNRSIIDAQIKEWNAEYTVAPGITQVSLVDDVEVSRKSGASGRAVDTEAAASQITSWLEKPSAEPVKLATKVLSPKPVYTRTYTRSSAALKIKLDNWIATHPGKYQVAIRELGGQGREASYNVSQQTVMASTYKAFLAFVAYMQAESGALNLGTVLSNGKTIEQCIEVAIVNSDNDCAIAVGRYIGWAKADQIIAAAGFRSVKLNNYNANGDISGDKLVNAKEQASFLAQLSSTSLINQAHTSTLLGYMKRQVYRDGIPAGSRGAVVADKVGFLENYLHDVGIVYGSKSTYALVIMSEGSSWSNIRDLSQAIYDFMNE